MRYYLPKLIIFISASQLVKDKTIMMANSISENVENDQENPRTDIATG